MTTFGEESEDDLDEDFNENGTCLQLYGLAVLAMSFEKTSRKRRCWVKPWLLRRPELGAYDTLLTELREEVL